MAARAAWRLDDLPAVSIEMQRVRDDARAAGNKGLEGRALVALAEVAAAREGHVTDARRLVEEALELLEGEDVLGRFDALKLLGQLGWWEGDSECNERYARQVLDVALESGRKDLQSIAAHNLAGVYMARLELDRAEELVSEAIALADASSSIAARGEALHLQASIHDLRGEHDEAVDLYEQAIALLAEAGAARNQARTFNHLAELLLRRGEVGRAEKLAREAIRILKPLGDRSYLCESQRILAEVLVEQGRLEEAERIALEARETVGPQDATSRATTRTALGVVRAAQGRDREAETLLREAVDIISETGALGVVPGIIGRLASFLRERGRDDDAAVYERRLVELSGPARERARVA
jgi:tetratricopeptide (TPR) repeat protein